MTLGFEFHPWKFAVVPQVRVLHLVGIWETLTE